MRASTGEQVLAFNQANLWLLLGCLSDLMDGWFGKCSPMASFLDLTNNFK
jgi:hypothetical protein